MKNKLLKLYDQTLSKTLEKDPIHSLALDFRIAGKTDYVIKNMILDRSYTEMKRNINYVNKTYIMYRCVQRKSILTRP